MSFANPYALLLLVAAVPLALMYLFREDERTMAVPSLMFWEPLTAHPAAPKSLRLRRFLSDPLFWLQLILMMLVVATLAEPVLQRSARRIVLVMDVSASMQTREAEGTRLEQAKTQARGLLDDLTAGDQAAVVEAGAQPEQRVSFTDDLTRIYDYLDALEAQDAAASLDGALTLAASLHDSSGAGDVVVITDQPVDPATTELQDHPVQMHVVNVGKTEVNAGFVGLSVQADAGGVAAHLTLRNFATQPSAGEVSAVQDGRPIFRESVSLTPGSTQPVNLTGITDPSPVYVTLTVQDSLSVDNRVVIIPFTGRRPRLSGATDDPEIGRLLRSLDGFETAVVPTRGRPPQDAGYAVYVCDGFIPDPLPQGGTLILNPPATDRFPAEEPVYDWDDRHPALRDIVLERLSLAGAAKLEPEQVPVWARVIARAREHPIVLAGEQDGFRRLMLMTDIARQMENPAALLLFLKALAWVNPAPAAENIHLKTGEPYTGPAPSDSAASIILPSGDQRRITPHHGIARWDETAVAGLYTLHFSGEERRFAANLLDARESDILPARAVPATPVAPALRAETSVDAAYWRWALQAALALLCLAWVYETLRRRTVG